MQQIRSGQLARWLATQAPDSPTPPDTGFHAPGAHEHQPVQPAVRPVEAPLLLDVREDWEAQICQLPGSLHIPMREIPARLSELVHAGKPIVCYCHHGVRSMQVAMFLEHHGVSDVYNLVGGINAWAREQDPSCPTY
jgi:rhodanese-related sulfurtransferase